jgi:ankyrin repeat protein
MSFERGYSPLHVAIENYSIEIVDLLLQMKVSLDFQAKVRKLDSFLNYILHTYIMKLQKDGKTPLHISMSLSSPQMAKKLIEAGAPWHIKDMVLSLISFIF